MNKDEFIAHKMKILVGKEGYSRPQAYAISLSYWNKEGDKAQAGGMFNQTVPQQNFTIPNINQLPNQGYDFSYNGFNPQPAQNTTQFGQSQFSNYSVPESLDYSFNPQKSFSEYNQAQAPQEPQTPTNPYTTNSVNIVNPYGGSMGLDYALNFTGEQFGKGNVGMGVAGAGLSLLKGARNFLTGYSTGKENRRVGQEYMDKTFDKTPNYTYGQQGGVKNSDIIAQNAIVDDPMGQINLEGKEFVMRTNGQVQPVVGDKHIENGKKADGVNANLEDGDKVLSNYVKLKPADIKDLKERYDISLKRGTTFAEAQKKLDQKLGIKKLETEKADILEKIEKATKIKDDSSKQLSLEVLTQKTGDVNEKLNTLSGIRANNFEFLFERQENQPKLGNKGELFDKNGKEVTESNQEVAQQGLQYNYQKAGDTGIAQQDINRINRNSSVEFTPDFAKAYFSTASTPPDQTSPTDYSQMPVLDITSDGQWTDRKVWRTQRPEWFVGKQEPVKGKDYTVVPYKQWGEYQKGQEYQKFSGDNQQLAELQQGGITELAKKYNVSPERAQELMSYQQGGEIPQEQGQDQMQQIFQAASQMIQAGEDPNTVIEALIQQGAGHEEAMQVVQQVMQQMQGQAPQNEMAEETGQEEMEVAQQGGEKEYYQAGGEYTFPTRVTPQLSGYETRNIPILNQDTLSGVEEWQPYTGKGYGAKMANIEDTIKVHDWYFDTEEKKKAFREAATKEGKQPEVEAFQRAYNNELENRAKKAGIPETDINSIKQQVGFSDTGVQKVDGLFGAFTSTRPLYDFTKKDGVVEAKVEAAPTQNSQQIETKNNVRNIMPNFGSYIPLFSPMSPIAKETVEFSRAEPIKVTPESMLAEQENKRQSDIARIEQSGLSPQQQAAILGQGMASSQLAANDAISKAEQYNAQNQFAVDQYNFGTAAKEDIMNAQFRQDFQNKSMQTLANQEESTRNQYRSNFLQEQANANKVINMNTANALNDQFAITDQGIIPLNNKSYELKTDYLTQAAIAKMTPEEYNAYKKMMALKGFKQ